MSNDQDRLASLERQLRNTRRLLAALVGVLVLACTVAAGPALVALATKGVEVRNPDGKPVIELKDSGDVTASGNATFGSMTASGNAKVKGGLAVDGEMTVGGKSVTGRFEELEKAVKAQAEATAAINASEAMTTKVVWQVKTLKKEDAPSDKKGKSHTFDFGLPVVEACSFVGNVDFKKIPISQFTVLDVHFLTTKAPTIDGTKVTVECLSMFGKGELNTMDVYVIARVKTTK